MRFSLPRMMQGSYHFETETYYDQLDGQMLLHHPRYFVLVERAQQAWIEDRLGAPRFDWRNFPDMYLVVRKLDAEYLSPIEGVQLLTVVLWPERIRAAKLVMRFELRSRDLQTVFCRGSRTNCKVNPESHEPTFWSDRFRAVVENEIQSRESAEGG
jgi:acyl-CoA thioesterase FadM